MAPRRRRTPKSEAAADFERIQSVYKRSGLGADQFAERLGVPTLVLVGALRRSLSQMRCSELRALRIQCDRIFGAGDNFLLPVESFPLLPAAAAAYKQAWRSRLLDPDQSHHVIAVAAAHLQHALVRLGFVSKLEVMPTLAPRLYVQVEAAAGPVLQVFGERDVLGVSEHRPDMQGNPIRVMPFTAELPNLLASEWRMDSREKRPAPVISLTAAAELLNSNLNVEPKSRRRT